MLAITLQQSGDITAILSHLSVIVAMIALLFQLRQNRLINRAAFRNQFTASTAKYIKLQEILLSNESLSHLNIEIYKKRLPQELNESEARIRGKELAFCAIMFQLMEDVWLTHGLRPKKKHHLFTGWNDLFKDWMSTESVAENWKVLKSHFSRSFAAYVEKEYLGPSRGVRTAEKIPLRSEIFAAEADHLARTSPPNPIEK